MPPQLNLLTVDLEEWFVVEALAGRFSVDDWTDLPSTVIKNSHRLLHLFDRKQVIATWFVLGWCAERFPDLIAEIAAAGHEIACHSFWHKRVAHMDRDRFRADTMRAMSAIENATGLRPVGYRAPSWSMTPSTGWAFETLAELGFSYDSSIFPIKHDLYGIPSGPRHLFRMYFDNGKSLHEMPASTCRLLGKNIPVGGGGYLRHSPYWYTRRAFRRLNARGEPVIVYVHPWEIDPEPPPLSGLTLLQKFRIYGSTDTLELKLARLLDEFDFCCMADYIGLRTRKRIGFERD